MACINKASLERELDSIENRTARIRKLLNRQRAAVTRIEKAGKFSATEARRLLQVTEDLQRLQQPSQDRMVNELFGLTIKLLNAH